MAKEFWKPGNMIYPLPAVMVSCQEGDKKPNIITIAWTGTICTNPAMVYISVRPERYSYDIIKNSGEFVINLTTKKLVKAADYCGVRSGREFDKFKEMNLTPEPGNKVKAPLIAECPVNIECKVMEIKELGSHHMFIAEVLGVNIDQAYMSESGKFQLNKTDLVLYSHGEYYGFGELLGSFGYSVRKAVEVKKKETQEKRRREISRMKKNIVLIGMPGAGKSTIGVILAKVLGYKFVDTDLLIQEQEHRLLKDIIAQEGLMGFIDIENRVNQSLETENAVIATGGSVIYGQEAMEHLREIAMVVYIKLNYATLRERLGNIRQRGVVFREGQNLKGLYEERCPLYEKYAHYVVDGEGLGVEELMEKIKMCFTNVNNVL